MKIREREWARWLGTKGNASGSRRRIGRRWAPVLFMGLVVALMFWPVWLLAYSYPVGGGDLWGQLYPFWNYASHSIRHGIIPMWWTGIMAGDPAIGEAQYGLLNPLNWGLFLAGSIPKSLVLFRGLIPLFIAGVGMYTYLRRSPIWRLPAFAALIGALGFMFSDPFFTHLGHPQINEAIAWLPWCLLAVDSVILGHRSWPLASLSLVLLPASGHYQTALFSSVAVILYALWRTLSAPPRTWLPRMGRLLVVGIVAIGLAMPILLPGLERYPFTERAHMEIKPSKAYSWPPEMTVDLLTPWFHGRGVKGFWAPWARVEGGYAGAVTLFLALAAVIGGITKKGEARVGFFVGLGALATVFALGYRAPLYPWLTRLDLIARMNKSARAIYLLAFSISILGAAGAATLARRRRTGSWIVAAALLIFGVLLWIQTPNLLEAVPLDRQIQALQNLRGVAILAWVCGALMVFISYNKQVAWLRSALVLILFAELLITSSGVALEPGVPQNPNPVIEYLKQDPNWFRVDVDGSARGLLSPSILLAAGFAVPQGTGNPMELHRYTRFYWSIPTKGSPVYQLLGAKYIVVPKGAPPGGEGIWPVFTEAPDVDIHLNTNALPRVWLAYETAPVADMEEAGAVLFSEDFRPSELATLEQGPRLDERGTGQLELRAYRPNYVSIGVETSTQALLVLSDIHYPGWSATLDGKPAPIYKTDGVFRGVVVPAGAHSVEMRYRPNSLRLGLGFAAQAGLIFAYALVRRQGADRRHREPARLRS